MFRHFEAAEHEFLMSIGQGYTQITTREVGYPRVHVEVDFQSALAYNDLIDIEVSVGRIGRSSFTFLFNVTKDGRQAARGKIVVAAMSPATQRACPVPETLVAALQPHLTERANSGAI